MEREPTSEELTQIDLESLKPVPIGFSIVKLITGDTLIGRGVIVGEMLDLDFPFYIDEIPEFSENGFDFTKKGLMFSFYNNYSDDNHVLIHDDKIVTINKASDFIVTKYLDVLKKSFGGISDLQRTSESLGVKNVDSYREKLDEIIKLQTEETEEN